MNVRKRGLALLMCICMIFTLLPFSAFADGTSEPDVVYGTYDNGPWTQDANAKDTVTRKTEGDNTLSLTKTAKRTADNTYDITLKVVSTQTETTTKPGSAATVLVMDVSGSMDICATCNNSEQHSDWDGNYWYEHSENCKIGKTRKVQDSETRLKAAKDAAYDFILSYSGAVLEDGQVTGLKDNAADGLGRYVSVVSFSTDSSVACEWKDVSTADGYNAVKAAIDGLKADGGTNLDAGLQTANTQLSKTTVASIKANAKNVIALTDGMPTFYVGGDGKNGNHGSYGCPDTNKATAKSATALKASASVYTVCFGASEDKCWEKDSEHNWEQKWHPIFGLTWVASEWHKTAGPTVGDFLSGSIATPAAGGKTYVYNADNTTELMTAFKAITSSITEGIKTGTVLDPMGDHITVTSKPDNFVKTANGYTWELGEPKSKVTENGKTTYTYELTYTVTFNPDFVGFDENGYYAANKETTFTAGGKVYNFNVPGVKGTAPKCTVTYNKGNHGNLADQDDKGNVATSVKLGSNTPAAPAVTPDDGYEFTGWNPTIAETVTEDVTYTAQYKIKDNLSYTVHYYWNGTNESVKADNVVTGQTFNTIVTEKPATVPGCTPVSADSKTITIGTDTNANVITFYYYKNVELEANSDTVTYDGEEHSVSGFTGAPEGADFSAIKVGATGTEAGTYPANFADNTVGTVDATGKYIVTKTTNGNLTIDPIGTVTVTITGKHDSKVYNGSEQSVEGYTVDAPDSSITVVHKEGKTAIAKGTTVGNYKMGLTAADFDVSSNNYSEIKVVVVDGYLNITPVTDEVVVTITGNHAEKIYNGTEQSVEGYTVDAPDSSITVVHKEGKTAIAKGTDVGRYEMNLKAEDFDAISTNYSNIKVVVVDGYLDITPVDETVIVKITGNHDSKVYNGTEQSVTGYTTDVGEKAITVALKEGKTAIAKGTNVGNYKMGLTAADFDVSSKNYSKIEVLVEDGYLDITPITDEVVVTITGHKDEFTYDGKEHTVKGYDTSISNQLYKATDFTFTGKAEVSRTEVGTSDMGLKADQFQNVSTNFTNVQFVVNDGSITIKERPYHPNPSITDKITVEITGNSDSVVYDGTEHSVKDYTVKISDSRYTEKDFTFSGKALASGVNAGTHEMGLKADQFKNTNARFANVEFIIKADGVLTITQRPLTITAGSAEGIAPVTCDKYTVEGLATGDKVDSVKLTGIQSEPGESPNVASDAVIKNAKGEDVTANYKITYVNGVLKAIEVLNKEIHFNYVIGYTDGTIRPNNDISRAEVATIFFRLLTDEAREQYTTTAGSFTDVKAGMWCNRAIATLTNMGIIKGYTDGSFQPNKSITRAELATIIARFAKLDVNTKTFSDINGHWAQKSIELAAGNGWINGYTDGTFRPNNNITRAETFAMINRVLDRQTESVSDLLPTSEMNMWSDNLNENAWYYKDVQEATNYHKCDRVGDSVYEKWTEKVPDIDWASYQI